MKYGSISFQEVSKTYENGVDALENVSFRIGSGEFVFITGVSGSGKSTIVKLLLKETQPTSGVIHVDGEDVTGIGADQIPCLRRKFGVVFQDFKLLDDRNVYENVAFAMRVVGASPHEIRRRVPEVLFLTGLTGKARAMPAEISGGEKQRVAIARAIANSPEILLADEPTGNLDPENSEQVMDLFAEINAKGTTVLMITHARDLVDRMLRRVIVMDHGRVAADRTGSAYTRAQDLDDYSAPDEGVDPRLESDADADEDIVDLGPISFASPMDTGEEASE